MPPCHREHGVARGAHCISYVCHAKTLCSNLRCSITQSFFPQICMALEAVHLKLHAKLVRSGYSLK